MYQAMIIIAWHQRVSSNVLFDEDVVRSVLSIFVTASILNFLRGTYNTFSPPKQMCVHVCLSFSPFFSPVCPVCHFHWCGNSIDQVSTALPLISAVNRFIPCLPSSAAVLDIVLSFNAWRSLKFTQILRYLLKFAVAVFWLVVMPVTYSRSVQNPSGIIRFFNNLGADWQTQSLYYYCVAIYLIPNILAALLFLFPFLRRSTERSNWRIINILMWWSQVSPCDLCS